MRLQRKLYSKSDEAARAEQKEKNKKEDLEKDLGTYQKGIAAGTTLTGVGGLSYGVGKLIEKEDAKRLARGIKDTYSPEKLKTLKRNGKILAAASIPLAGYASYKYLKTKKKLKKDDTKA